MQINVVSCFFFGRFPLILQGTPFATLRLAACAPGSHGGDSHCWPESSPTRRGRYNYSAAPWKHGPRAAKAPENLRCIRGLALADNPSRNTSLMTSTYLHVFSLKVETSQKKIPSMPSNTWNTLKYLMSESTLTKKKSGIKWWCFATSPQSGSHLIAWLSPAHPDRCPPGATLGHVRRGQRCRHCRWPSMGALSFYMFIPPGYHPFPAILVGWVSEHALYIFISPISSVCTHHVYEYLISHWGWFMALNLPQLHAMTRIFSSSATSFFWNLALQDAVVLNSVWLKPK